MKAGDDQRAVCRTAPTPEAKAPVDFDNALAVLRFGAEVVDTGIDDRLAAALSPTDAEGLVARLDALRRALEAGNPRARRRPGLVARLIGRDVLDEAEDVALRERVGVLLLDADRSADALVTLAAAQEALYGDLGLALAALAARVAEGHEWLARHPDAGVAPAPGPTPARVRFERRLQQLDTVHAAWGIARAQLAQVRDQTLDLLARHRRIRDVLLPAWRQQALGGIAGGGVRRARLAASAHAAIASEVEAMTAKLDPADRGPTPHGDGP